MQHPIHLKSEVGTDLGGFGRSSGSLKGASWLANGLLVKL